ncbi:WD40-repeat-containing domain protein [Powellomyces hirtus]|nr:WD40-repeat-containing domain protein [Powellomyces hirtus]
MLACPRLKGTEKYSVSLETQFRARAPLSVGALDITDNYLVFPSPSPRGKLIKAPEAQSSSCVTIVGFENGVPDEEANVTRLNTKHVKPILAARFGTRSVPRTLVTASVDAISFWLLPASPPLATNLEPKKLLKEKPGKVAHLCLDVGDNWIAACIDDAVHVIEVETLHTVVLQGHLGKVTASAFFVSSSTTPNAHEWLLSISEDRTFKVWDIANTCCLYQSAILSPSLLTSIAMSTSRFCIGSEDGKLRFHEWVPRRGNPCEPRCLKTVDIPHVLDQTAKALDAASSARKEPLITYVNSDGSHRFDNTTAEMEEKADRIDYSNVIIALNYSTIATGWHDRKRRSDDEDGSVKNIRLIVGCVSGVIVMNPATYEILHHFQYADDMELAGAYAISRSCSIPRRCMVVTGNGFSGTINVLSLTEHAEKELDNAGDDAFAMADMPLDAVVSAAAAEHVRGDWYKNVYRDCMVELSKLGIRSIEDLSAAGSIEYPLSIPTYVQKALKDVCGKSGLAPGILGFPAPTSCVYDMKSPIRPKERKREAIQDRRTHTKVTPKKPNKQGALIDQPVTFHSKVKSSGYISSPRGKNKPVARKLITGKQRSCVTLVEKDAVVKSIKLFPSVNHGGSITSLEFSPSGLALATSSVDRSVRYHRPLSTEDTTKALIGHNGPVTNVTWSTLRTGVFNQLMLTASMDGSARLWTVLQAEPLLEFRHSANTTTRPSISSRKTSTTTPPRVIHSDVLNARFYYQDRFIVIPSGSKTHMYTYTLDKPDSGSVKPQLNYNSYKLATTFACSAQNVTAVACLNKYRSHLILTAASDKSLQIWDVAECRVVQTIEHAQERAIHCIGVADYENPPSAFETSFVTSAATDSIKTWDLRTGKPTLHLHGHANRHAKVGCAISPCGRFLVTGSEDNHAYLYDIRKGSVIEKLAGHTDVVSSVGFNPCNRMVATGGHDGRLRLFSY